MRGSVVDRSRHWQRKMNGMITWHLDFVMECLPLMLQAALLLGYALSNYFLFINRAVAGVPIQSPLLLTHRFGCYPILQLSVPNPCLPHPSLLGSFRRRAQEVPQANQEVVQGHLLSEEGTVKTQVRRSLWFWQVWDIRWSRHGTYRVSHGQHGRPANPTVQ